MVWRVGRGLLLLVLATVLVMGAMRVPVDTWIAWGSTAAIVSAGLEHPKESVTYIQTVQVPDADNAHPTVPAGNGVGVLAATNAVIPPKGDGGGTVEEQTLGGGTAVCDGVTAKIADGVTWDLTALAAAGSPLTATDTDAPQVLIVHTHATECYMPYFAGYYNADDATRSADNHENTVAVGEAIAKELRARGIGVIHDTTQHDNPAYTGAYTRSEQTILSHLKANPSVRVVLDIHRDAIHRENNTKVKPTVTVDGRKAAQVMAVIGSVNTEALPNAHCEYNLRLGLAFHKAMNTAYAGIMRPLYAVNARYNQGLQAGSMLLEIGTDANTLSEAIYSGQLVGRQLAALLS